MYKVLKNHPIKLIFIAILITLIIFHQWILSLLGNFLVYHQEFAQAEVAVVLNTGAAIYPRIIEAADLYKRGKVKQIIINGNRKTDTLRRLENMGYQPAHPWYENSLRVLELLGVPRKQVISISAEHAYDTVSEAEAVGHYLLKNKIKSVVVTTSKSHTKRAAFIWNNLYGNDFTIYSYSAKSDPYVPDSWWHEGRQIRWVLAIFILEKTICS